MITAQDGMASSAVGLSSIKFGRVEGRVKAAAGANIAAAFKLAPVSDMYDGENNKNLQTHKQENKDKHKKYRERFGKPVVFVYYNADTNSYNFDEIYDRATDTGKKN